MRGKVAMICEVGVITPIRESDGGRTLHGFNVIGINRRPLVTFNYETEEEAAASCSADAPCAACHQRHLIAPSRHVLISHSCARNDFGQ